MLSHGCKSVHSPHHNHCTKGQLSSHCSTPARPYTQHDAGEAVSVVYLTHSHCTKLTDRVLEGSAGHMNKDR